MSDDVSILRHYVATRSQAAFAELVQRHLNLVYAVALRQVGGDAHLAEDVAQQVFVALARKASSLTDRATITGWLYRSTHFAASDVVRSERRRRSREQEAHSMNLEQSPSSPGPIPESAVEWEALRPTIDAAIAELGEADRDAVSLRFFENRSFAEVGARLKLTENAARMRVERALDKLHGSLARRGVTSTSAALGIALANQAVASVPAGLAATITGAAVAGSAVGSIGVLSWITMGKAAAGLGAGATAVAIGIASWQYMEKSGAERDATAARQQLLAARAELSSIRAKLDETERRAREAERDNESLLKAADRARAEQGTEPRRSAAVLPATGTMSSVTAGRSAEEDARLAQARAYQQQLAKRRAEEAQARAKIDSEAALDPDPEARYHKLIVAAENYVAAADFPAAIRTLNLAMQMKSAATPISDRVRQLQFALRDQNKPVEISLISDGLTLVSLVGPYGQRAPSPLQSTTLTLPPANYEVIGRRPGYQDVRIPVEVRGGVPAPVIQVACTVPAATKE